MTFQPKQLSLAIAAAMLISAPVFAAEEFAAEDAEQQTLKTVVVTAEAMDAPLTVVTDPKAPKQPLPAHDGADYLKTVPGFSVTRKGGTDGDAVFRGMAGSRLSVLADGENILGGCNFRMDAPTAYIYPEIYDSLTVIKGPQSVQYGPGNSAATVMFERDVKRFSEADYRVHASALAGSADRRDVLADVQAGSERGYVQLTGTDSTANDYVDGNGDKVHSQYHRYSGNVAAGWTPDDDTRVEVSAAQSDGEAAYADRGMDGTKFLRESRNFTFEKKHLSDLLDSVELRVYDSNVDHIMDDQELRVPGMMGYANLKRDTDGGRFSTVLALAEDAKLTLGVDTQNNVHSARSATPNHIYSAWSDDANFNQYGLFAELNQGISDSDRIVAGYRADRWEATDERATVGMMMPVANPSANETRSDTLGSGFARLEHELASSPTTLYAGVGHSERFPDYWEMIAKESVTTVSAFAIKPETTNQLDVGALYKKDDLDVSVSAFYNRIDDFILADYSSMMKMNGASRNIDATTYGSEIGAGYSLTDNWKADTSVAWVWGENRTDDTALAQLPPLEARLGLTYSRDDWSVGGLWRAVEAQERYDLNMGNIVGKDLGESSGFSVFSLNGSWKATKNTLLTAGVDNLFDKTYAEFVSRAGGNGMGGVIPGYVQTDRVNEPGRTLWLKVQADF
jgi:iron complex outermembrane receptor protein